MGIMPIIKSVYIMPFLEKYGFNLFVDLSKYHTRIGIKPVLNRRKFSPLTILSLCVSICEDFYFK